MPSKILLMRALSISLPLHKIMGKAPKKKTQIQDKPSN